MGATLSLAWFTPGWMYFAHIGDSRIYYRSGREGTLRQITHDDTYVGWLFRKGEINEREARTHPRRNVLQRALGAGNQFVEPQVGAVVCEPRHVSWSEPAADWAVSTFTAESSRARSATSWATRPASVVVIAPVIAAVRASVATFTRVSTPKQLWACAGAETPIAATKAPSPARAMMVRPVMAWLPGGDRHPCRRRGPRRDRRGRRS